MVSEVVCVNDSIPGKLEEITMVYCGNICQITHEGLGESVFKRSPVWCECFAPSEIDFLVNCGESRSFLESHLVNKDTSSGDGRTFYSWPLDRINAQAAPLPEFAHISANLDIFGKLWAGFLWIVGGELTGITIFSELGDIDFSLNEDLRDENALALAQLTQRSEGKYFQIKVDLIEALSSLLNYGTVQIPV